MKITEQTFIQKALKGYYEYKAREEEEVAFSQLQTFLEDLAVALMEKGIQEINGQNFTLTTTLSPHPKKEEGR